MRNSLRLLFLTAIAAASALRAPPPIAALRAPPPIASAAAANYAISTVKGDDASIMKVTDFFVRGFWQEGTTVGKQDLSIMERTSLVSQQNDDMIMRYGELVGQRRLRSRLMVAKDDADEVVGCVGVEMALVQPQTGQVLSRSQGEGLLANELSSMGGRERNQFRKMGVVELTAALFPEYQVYALLANLAVAPSTRGAGLGRALCASCEAAGSEWGVAAIMLQVEEVNEPARKLYESVGYSLVHKDEAATALRVQPGAGAGAGLLRNEVSTLLLLGKGLP